MTSKSGFSDDVTEFSLKIRTLFLVDTPTLPLHIKQWVLSFSESAVIFLVTVENNTDGKTAVCTLFTE